MPAEQRYAKLTASEASMQKEFFATIRLRQAVSRRTDTDLANEAGICQSYYSMLQNNKRRLSLMHARRVAQAVGLTAKLILTPIDETES